METLALNKLRIILRINIGLSSEVRPQLKKATEKQVIVEY